MAKSDDTNTSEPANSNSDKTKAMTQRSREYEYDPAATSLPVCDMCSRTVSRVYHRMFSTHEGVSNGWCVGKGAERGGSQ